MDSKTMRSFFILKMQRDKTQKRHCSITNKKKYIHIQIKQRVIIKEMCEKKKNQQIQQKVSDIIMDHI